MIRRRAPTIATAVQEWFEVDCTATSSRIGELPASGEPKPEKPARKTKAAKAAARTGADSSAAPEDAED
jgi:hypothetical protein